MNKKTVKCAIGIEITTISIDNRSSDDLLVCIKSREKNQMIGTSSDTGKEGDGNKLPIGECKPQVPATQIYDNLSNVLGYGAEKQVNWGIRRSTVWQTGEEVTFNTLFKGRS